jgi:hypothetical protein
MKENVNETRTQRPEGVVGTTLVDHYNPRHTVDFSNTPLDEIPVEYRDEELVRRNAEFTQGIENVRFASPQEEQKVAQSFARDLRNVLNLRNLGLTAAGAVAFLALGCKAKKPLPAEAGQKTPAANVHALTQREYNEIMQDLQKYDLLVLKGQLQQKNIELQKLKQENTEITQMESRVEKAEEAEMTGRVDILTLKNHPADLPPLPENENLRYVGLGARYLRLDKAQNYHAEITETTSGSDGKLKSNLDIKIANENANEAWRAERITAAELLSYAQQIVNDQGEDPELRDLCGKIIDSMRKTFFEGKDKEGNDLQEVLKALLEKGASPKQIYDWTIKNMNRNEVEWPWLLVRSNRIKIGVSGPKSPIGQKFWAKYQSELDQEAKRLADLKAEKILKAEQAKKDNTSFIQKKAGVGKKDQAGNPQR